MGLTPRLASISVSPPPKLLSLEEARRRVASTPSRPPPPKPKLVEKYQSYPSKGATPKKESASVSPRRISEGAVSKKSYKTVFSKGKSFITTQEYETTPSYYRSISSEGHRDAGRNQVQIPEPYESHRQREVQSEIQTQSNVKRLSQNFMQRQEKEQHEKREHRASERQKTQKSQKDRMIVPKEGTVTYGTQFKASNQGESWESRLNHMAVARAMQARYSDSHSIRSRSYSEINRAVDDEQKDIQKTAPQSSSLQQVTRVHIKHVKQSPIDNSIKESSQIKLYFHKAEPRAQMNGTSDKLNSPEENKPVKKNSSAVVTHSPNSESPAVLGPASSSQSNIISVPVHKAEHKPRAYYRTFSDPSGSEESDPKASSGSFSGRVTSAISIPVSVSNERRSVVSAVPNSRVSLSRSNTVSGSVSSSGSSSGAMIRRHPVLHSFKRVSADRSVYYTKVKYHQASGESQSPKAKGVHRRASTGGHGTDTKSSALQSSDYRSMSVCDNRPTSVYDNEPSSFRYSSPLVCTFNSVSNEQCSSQRSSSEVESDVPQTLNWVQSALYRTETV